MSKNTRLPNSLHYLQSVLQNKCPRCREGDLFVSSHPYRLEDGMTMHEKCMVCGQPTEIEVGFYYGTGYVSYALSVAFIISSFVAWKVLIGVTFAIDDNRIFLLDGDGSCDHVCFAAPFDATFPQSLAQLVCAL
jgi:uncharacterized protein (DUF983 family)